MRLGQEGTIAFEPADRALFERMELPYGELTDHMIAELVFPILDHAKDAKAVALSQGNSFIRGLGAMAARRQVKLAQDLFAFCDSMVSLEIKNLTSPPSSI